MFSWAPKQSDLGFLDTALSSFTRLAHMLSLITVQRLYKRLAVSVLVLFLWIPSSACTITSSSTGNTNETDSPSTSTTNTLKLPSSSFPSLTLISSPDGITGGTLDNIFFLKSVNDPQINDAGQVVFVSEASNLPGYQFPYSAQIYFWSIEKGLICICSQMFSPVESLDSFPSYYWMMIKSIPDIMAPQINNAGQVVFCSNAPDLPGAASDGSWQVYLWDPEDGIRLVSSPDDITGGYGGSCQDPQINDFGQIVFESSASNLPGSYQDGSSQLYMWDVNSGIFLVSTNDGATGVHTTNFDNAATFDDYQINNAGQIVFGTNATELPGAASDGSRQIYLWESDHGLTLISSPDGITGGYAGSSYYGGGSFSPQINNSGQIVFGSDATNLPGAAGDYSHQIYLWESDHGLTLISSEDGITGWYGGNSFSPRINNSGQIIFTSSATNRPGSNNETINQLYYWDPGYGINLIVNKNRSYSILLSQINDAGNVIFQSDDRTLPGSNGYDQVYLWSPPANWSRSSR